MLGRAKQMQGICKVMILTIRATKFDMQGNIFMQGKHMQGMLMLGRAKHMQGIYIVMILTIRAKKWACREKILCRAKDMQGKPTLVGHLDVG